MATKKTWFGLAAVGTAITGAVAVVVAKARKSPEAASEVLTTIKDTAKESPAKVASAVGAAKEKVMPDRDQAETIEAEASDEADQAKVDG